MDLKQLCIEAYQQQEADKAARQAASDAEYNLNLQENLRIKITKLLPGDVDILFHENGRTYATVEGLDGVIFTVDGTSIPRTSLEGTFNGTERRLFDLADLGELLATPEPEPEVSKEPNTKPDRFGDVSVREANRLSNEGRQFVVRGVYDYDGDPFMVIEFTDIYQHYSDELPF